MESQNKEYELIGNIEMNTEEINQSEITSDLRAIEGITIVNFTPNDRENIRDLVRNNKNYQGSISIKFDITPFSRVPIKSIVKKIIVEIKSTAGVNYFKSKYIS